MMGDATHETRAVFTAALALTAPEARARYLDEACKGKPELRCRIEALLHAHDQAGGFLEDHGPSPAADALPEGPGTLIGRYKLLEEIGEGAFGEVFMAEQTEPVHRKVALKIVKAGMDTREVIARFEAERQALALMDHPNIAKIFDAGVTGAPSSQLSTINSQLHLGRPYFVMELVNGIPITTYCDQQQVSTAGRLQLFMKVCAAVQHAHQKGIIHRDLKPTNILVTVIDGEPVPKVIDFGVAKALGQKLTEKTVFTAFQQMIGTPAYMSPEQAALSGVDVDTRSDIYSLGVLLYELLTGVTPFDQDTLRKAALDEIRRLIRETEPPKPSTRLQGLAKAQGVMVSGQWSVVSSQRWREVHGDLDWIVMKALEKDRARRYDTASAIAEDIQHHLNHEPVHASPPSAAYRARKFIRRHRLGVATATALTVALAAGLTLALIGFEQARRERDRAERLAAEKTRQRQRAEAGEAKAKAEAARSEQVAQFLQDMLKGVGPSAALGRDTTMLREILDKTAGRLAKDLAGQPEVEADLRATLGGVYRDLGFLAEALAMQSEALATRRRLYGNQHLMVASALKALGETRHHQRAWPEALTCFREALAIQTVVLGERHLEVAKTLSLLGGSLRFCGELDQAEAATRKALAIRRELLGGEDKWVADSLKGLGLVLASKRRFSEAEPLYREALAICRKHPDEDKKVEASILCSLGHILNLLGRRGEAEACLREAVQWQRQHLGEHRSLVFSLWYLSETLEGQGRTVEAESILNDAALVLIHKPDLMRWGAPILDRLLTKGEFDKSESLLREALSVLEGQRGSGHPSTVGPRLELAGVLEMQGKEAEAEAARREALAQVKKGLETDNAGVMHSLNKLSDALARQGKLAEEGQVWRDVWLAQREILGSNNPGTLRALEKLMVLAAATADWQQGLEYGQNLMSASVEDLPVVRLPPVMALLAGQPKTYRDQCKLVLSRFGQTTDLVRAGDTARVCTLAPDPDLDLNEALRLADYGMSAGGPDSSWRPMAKGQVEYRLGHFKEALRHLQALQSHSDPKLACAADYFAAMAHHQLNQPAEALTALEQANHLFPDCLYLLACASQPWACFDPAAAIVFRAEAERMILGHATAPKVDAALLQSVRDSWLTIFQLRQRAQVARKRKDWVEAETLLRDALARSRKLFGDTHRSVEELLAALATVLHDSGRLAEAETVWRQELATERRLSGNVHLFVANSLEVLATVLDDQGKLAEAEAAWREAIQIRCKTLGSGDTNLAYARASLVHTLLRQDKFAEAELPARECLALREKQMPDSWSTFNAQSLLGGSLLGQQKYVEAEPLLLSGYQGLKQREGSIGEKLRPVLLREALQRLVQLYDATGRADQAVEWKQKLAEFEKVEAEK